MKYILVIAISSLALTLAACAAPAAPAEEAISIPAEEPPSPPASNACKASQTTPREFVPKRQIISKELIFLGKETDIDVVVDMLDIDGDAESRSIDFADLPSLNSTLAGTIYDDWSDVDIRLVGTNHDYAATTSLVEIYQLIYEPSPDLTAPVFVDFNYLTGRSPITGSGDPNGVGAHPFGQAIASAGDTSDFRDQWAFLHIGAYSGQNSTIATHTNNSSLGAGKIIAVFDTSPYEMSGRKNVPIQIHIPSGQTQMSIDVHCPLVSGDVPPKYILDYVIRDEEGNESDSIDTGTADQYGNHGIFVSGLAYGVAPRSHIQLVRVLDDAGVGDLFWLLNGLVAYLLDNPELERTVLNLSLGIVPGQATLDPTQSVEVCNLLKGSIDDTSSLPADCNDIDTHAGGFLDMSEVVPLRTLLGAAQQKGAVIVAAAGNDSAGDESMGFTPVPPFPSQIPASYSFVYGVAATNNNGERSCFSNLAPYTAPGGDALDTGADINDESDDNCNPENLVDCVSEDCALVSVVFDESQSAYSFAYWFGTSFATPLVSGAFATTMEDQLGSEITSSLLPEATRELHLANLCQEIGTCP